MHILHALFTHAQGGLGQAHVHITQALVAKGHRVTGLMHPQSPYLASIAIIGEIETVQPHGFYDFFAIGKIRRLLKTSRPDVILAHNARAIHLCKHAARGLGIPILGMSHSYKTARTMQADRLIVLSDHMRRHFLAAGCKAPIDVVPNLIHLPPKYTPHARGTPPVIGAIGRFTKEKGFPDLLDALHRLKQTGANFVVHIGGGGPDENKLKIQAKSLGLNDHIHWMGWVEDKTDFYRGLDVLCIPSREDSFPLVVLEGLAYGVPMVTTDAPGPAEMLTHNTNALIVARQDTPALASALHTLLTQPELAGRLAEAGWRRAQDFGFDSIATLWDKIIKSTAANSKGLVA
jgi:glycosyltransferase involved in cell wall biosynthesis